MEQALTPQSLVTMSNSSDFFNDDGSPKRCPKCNSFNFTKKVLGILDVYQDTGPICEAEYFCECGKCVGYWAYGSWDSVFLDTYLENNPK